MEYIYAALLLHKLGKPINEENVKKVMEAAGATPDETRIKAMVAALSGVNIDEAISKSAAVAAPAAAPAKAEAPKEEKKEEKKVSMEEATQGLSSLFG